jgi:hypothetical protein
MHAFKLATKVTAARKLAKRFAPQIHSAIDSAGSAAKSKLPAQHHTKVDSGARMVKKVATGSATDTRASAARRG